MRIEERVLHVLREVLGNEKQGLHEPQFLGSEIYNLTECVDSGFVSSIGQYVVEFESRIQGITGSAYAVAVVNGTAALQVALKVAGVSSGDEVLIPTLSFVATCNAVLHLGAVPHFLDSCSDSLGLDAEALDEWLSRISEKTSSGLRNKETGRVIRALIPVHVFGHPCDLTALELVANKYGLVMIEDAAESLGSSFKGRHTGTFGELGVISFNGNKIVTAGGGGVILTDCESNARHAKHLTTTAKVPHQWEYFHDEIGYNFRMPNINAALACAQLDSLPIFLEKKRLLAERYTKRFEDLEGVSILREPTDARSNFWLQAIILDKEYENSRDALLDLLNREGFGARPIWHLLHKLPFTRSCPSAPIVNAESWVRRVVNIPSNPKST